MGNKEIKANNVKLKFVYDSDYDVYRVAVIITDLPYETVKGILRRLPLVNDSMRSVKIRHTTKWIIVDKLKSFIERSWHIGKEVKYACSSDFNRHQYAE